MWTGDSQFVERITFLCAPAYIALVNKLFSALDQNRSGGISPLELFNGLGQVRAVVAACRTTSLRCAHLRQQLLDGSLSEKAEFFFRLYDFDGTGSLDKDEVIHMVVNSQETIDNSVAVAMKMLRQLDIDGNGRVSLREFKVAVVGYSVPLGLQV